MVQKVNIPASTKPKVNGFSLIELLLVMLIICALGTLSGVAFQQLSAANGLNRAGRMAADLIALGRQEAATRNQEVRVLFYQMGTGSNAEWSAMQLFKVMDGKDTRIEPLSRIVKLPDGVVFTQDEVMSPLLSDSGNPISDRNSDETVNIPPDCLHYAGFRIQPGGALESSVSNTNNFFTLVHHRDKAKKDPVNFYTLQVNTITGKVSHHRP